MRLESDIQSTIEQASDFLLLNGVDHESALRYTLFLEEALLVYQGQAGFDSFSFECTKHKKTVLLKLTVPGRPLDPFEDNLIISKALERLENPPAYTYHAGKNIISYKPILLIPSLKSVAFLWRHIRGARGSFIVSIILNALEIAASIFIPIVSAMVISSLTSLLLERLLYMGIALLVLRLVRNAFVFTYQNLYSRVYEQMVDSLSAVLTEKMLDIRIESIRHFGSGIFIQRLTDDMTGLTQRFDSFLDLCSDLIKSVGILLGIALVSPPLFCFQLVAMTVLLCIELRRTSVLAQNERKNRMANEAYTDIINEIVRGNREIKLYRGKEVFLQTVRERSTTVTSLAMRKRRQNNSFNFTRWNLRDAFCLVFLLIEIYFIRAGRLEVTMAVVLFNYCETLLPTINTFAFVAELTKMLLLSCERLYHLMLSRDFPCESFGDVHPDSLDGEIRFRNVSFAYPIDPSGRRGRTVLKNMDFTIRPGEYVAITGRSGAGKSTIFNLITKLYDTQLGEVSLGGINIKRLDEESIRKNVSIVTQNPYLLHMSIRDNLRLVKKDATDEEMIDACKKACIHDDILRMSDQYDTILTEEGSNLSGGQRQRLMIAMCILKDAPILLMDEATSALDNITQTAIQQNITSLSGTHTIIVIAHRMSTIVNCDRILFMDDGQIIASGTHEELLKSCEGYRLLYESDGKPKNDLVDETE